MRKIFILMFTAAIFMCSGFKAGVTNFNVTSLHISWEVVDNNYQNKGGSLTALVITNKGHQVLPATGWKIYFNSARGFAENAAGNNARIEQVNGDLYSITPAGSFAALKPDSAARIEMISDENVVNFTDAPEGPYLVWDAQADKGYSFGAYDIKPYKPAYQGLVTPQLAYSKNKSITDIPAQQLTKVFPTPVSYTETGGFLTLDDKAGITADNAFTAEANYIKAGNLFGKKLTGAGAAISLIKAAGIAPEGYELKVTPQGITISASTSAGMFYGIQSLKTLIPADAPAKKSGPVKIPCVDVKDEPRFGYRAVVLDVARNFQSKQEIIKLLEAMSLYKLNTLHLHLTDDEGWRIEIPALPELTAVGSKRGHTLDSKHFLPASHGSGPDLDNPIGSGYYTTADYVEILKYATARHITVVPEIETPGHARASVKAMEARYDRLMAAGNKAGAEKYLLTDPDDKSQYRSVQFWNDNVIDVSLPSTYNFVETVVNGLIDLYKQAGAPLPIIHFGGDEVPAHVWEQSPAYLALKATHPEIKSTGDLWYYFYGRVNQILKAKGIHLAGWEEMALRKTTLDGNPTYVPNPDFVEEHLQAEVWNNVFGGGQEDLAYRLANGGYKVLLTNVTNLYFDMAYYKSYDEPGYYWGAFVDMEKAFSFIPFDCFKNAETDKNGVPLNKAILTGKQRLTEYGKSNIIGLQGALWGETVKGPDRMEYMMFPRMLALAERAWEQDPAWATESDTTKSKAAYQLAWANFMNVVGKRELPRLNYYNGGYKYRVSRPGISLQDGKYTSNVEFPGLTIRYTTNGKDPDNNSKVYTGPVTYNGGVIKFRAFDAAGRGGNIAEGDGQ